MAFAGSGGVEWEDMLDLGEARGEKKGRCAGADTCGSNSLSVRAAEKLSSYLYFLCDDGYLVSFPRCFPLLLNVSFKAVHTGRVDSDVRSGWAPTAPRM